MVLHRRTISSLIFLLPISLLIGGCVGRSTKPADIALTLPEPSPPLVDIVLLLDQSGSLNGAAGTDPTGVRVEAARYLVANVSEKSAADAPNRLAVVDFGDGVSPGVAQLQPVTPAAGYTEISSRISAKSMGGTNIVGALTSALKGLQAARGLDQGHKGRIVLFTDGKPEDDRKLSTDQYFAEIKQYVDAQLKPYGVDLYVIAVDRIGEIWAECGERWKSIAGADHVVRIESVGQLRERFNETINSIFSIPSVPPDTLTVGRKSFTIKPYLDRVEFHVFPTTPEMKLRILRPDGSALAPGTDRDVRRRQFQGYEIISVFDPKAGEWQYEVTAGQGRIEVYRNEVPLQMNLVLPKGTHPQGKPISIVASFARRSGKPVESEPQYPLGLSAQVLGPTGEPANVQFGSPVNGHYYGDRQMPTKLPGVYKVTLRVQAGTALDTSAIYNIKVTPTPYLSLVSPSFVGFPFGQQYLRVSGMLMVAGKPVAAEKYFSNHPNLLYLAQLSDLPDRKDSSVQWLSSRDGAQFAADFPLPMRQRLFIQQPLPGDCILHIEHAGKMLSGQDASDHDITMMSVPIRTTGWALILRVLIGILLLYAAVLCVAWIGLLVRILTARKMQLAVTIAHGKTGELLANIRTSGRAWSFVRTKPWKDSSAKSGKPSKSVRPRSFVFYGADRLGKSISCGHFVAGIPIFTKVKNGQSRVYGQIRVQA